MTAERYSKSPRQEFKINQTRKHYKKYSHSSCLWSRSCFPRFQKRSDQVALLHRIGNDAKEMCGRWMTLECLLQWVFEPSLRTHGRLVFHPWPDSKKFVSGQGLKKEINLRISLIGPEKALLRFRTSIPLQAACAYLIVAISSTIESLTSGPKIYQ